MKNMTLREDLLQSPAFVFDRDLFYQKSLRRNLEFEKAYIGLRTQENRLYDDDIVKKLPHVAAAHPLKGEWDIRRISTEKLIRYFTAKIGPKKILEIGCGNGWLANQLSRVPNSDVLAIDVNETELQQASRVFRDRTNLTFAYADIMQLSLLSKFDFIVLASTIQYFKDIRGLLNRVLEFLSPSGEIHILDSPIYKSSAVESARQRSSQYFDEKGVTMHAFYHHHDRASLREFNSTMLYNPGSLINRVKKLLSPNSPFPWLRIIR